MVKVAIPSTKGSGLEDVIFEHFGHAPYFTFVEVEDGEVKKVEVVKNPYEGFHSPGELPSFLKENGVSVLICMGIGFRAKAFFEEYGIKVYTGATGRIEDVLSDYVKGVLKSREYEVRRKWNE